MESVININGFVNSKYFLNFDINNSFEINGTVKEKIFLTFEINE